MEMQLAEAAKAPEEMDADFVLECAEAALELQNIRCELSDEEIAAKVAAIPFKNTESETPKTRRKTVNVRRVLAIAAALAGTLMIMCVMAIAEEDKLNRNKPITENPYEALKDIEIEGPIRSREELEEKIADYEQRLAAAKKEIDSKNEQGYYEESWFVKNGGVYVVYDNSIEDVPIYAKYYPSLEETVKAENLDIIYPTKVPEPLVLCRLVAESFYVNVSWHNPYSETTNYYCMFIKYSEGVEINYKNMSTLVEIGGIDCYELVVDPSMGIVIAFEYNGNCYYISGPEREVVESLVENMLSQ